MQVEGTQLAARESQVKAAMVRLNNVIDGLSAIEGRLIGRIGTVLTPATPAEALGEKDIKEVNVQLAEELNSMATSIDGIRLGLESVIDRIEL